MFEKVATPATAATVAVPPSVAPPGFAPIARVTFPAKPGVGLPLASSAVTTIGAMAAPAAVFAGCVETKSAAGAPAEMLNVVDVAGVSVPLDATMAV